MLSEDFVKLLACPACESRPALTQSSAGDTLECVECRRRYPIRDDIPVLLLEEAQLPDDGAASNEQPAGK